jgi:hypothetical protein
VDTTVNPILTLNKILLILVPLFIREIPLIKTVQSSNGSTKGKDCPKVMKPVRADKGEAGGAKYINLLKLLFHPILHDGTVPKIQFMFS